MKYPIIISPGAKREIDEIYHWYEGEEAGAGNRFKLALAESIEKIRNSPKTYAIIYRGARKLLLRNFPYNAYFRVTQDAVRVLAVIHTSRSDKQWKSRIRK